MDEKFCKKNKNGFTWILQKQNNSRIDEKIFLLYDNHQGLLQQVKRKAESLKERAEEGELKYMKKQQLKPEPYMMNRELSWLKFNERVLNEAGNPAVPLAERLTFASIYQSNLDEFYRVEVGTLMDQMESKEVVKER